MQKRFRLLHGLLLLTVVAALFISGIHPFDRTTWWLEVAPVFVAAAILFASHRRFPLTDLLYVLIAAHALVLILGGAYSYARVPFGFWLQDAFSLARNPYDRVGHFMQGFVPAMIAREILVRGAHVAGRKMTTFLCIAIALAISASYELIEWAAAVILGQGADEFLGTQGDVWDTQWDMFMALVGASSAMLLLSRWHDRWMARLKSPQA